MPQALCDRQVNMIVENDSSDKVDENHEKKIFQEDD
jgi:hypothetical protein